VSQNQLAKGKQMAQEPAYKQYELTCQGK